MVNVEEKYQKQKTEMKNKIPHSPEDSSYGLAWPGDSMGMIRV